MTPADSRAAEAAEPAEPAETWRWSLARVDADQAFLTIRNAGGVKAWPDTGKSIYQLAGCKVRVFHATEPTELRIDGPTAAAVRDAARRMLYPDTEGTISRVSPAHRAHGGGRA